LEVGVAKVAVIGAGVGGLATALALSRSGHHVTIIERDATPTPTDPDAAFEWERRGAPQVRHSHALLARLHNLLRDRYPDVLERLLAAGATELRFCDKMPPEIDDPSPQPGDDDLVALACRRTTFEWVLRTVVLDDPDVELRDGVAVAGLALTTDAASGIPRVNGVRLASVSGNDQDAELVEADLVVAATGRRSPIGRWLGEHGIEPTVTEEDTGIVYLSRFYRLRDGSGLPPQDGPVGGDLGYLKYAVFLGDNRTFSVTFAVRTHDDELRAALLDPDTFDRAAALLPATSPWAADDLADPITPVHVMGGLLNRLVGFRDEAGVPLVLGFHAVGDAHTCTNPLYGRGCSLAAVQANLLRDAIDQHPDDFKAQADAYEDASALEVEPWYKAARSQDRMARAQAAVETGTAAEGTEAPPAESNPMGLDPKMARDLMREGLLPAVRLDAVVYRAFLRAFNLLAPPDALLSDADLIARVLTVYQDRDNRPAEPVLGPPRAEMLTALVPRRERAG
jgi:2-polyprenyl-6-methoxyphenol hydroxylase-like FAD-dependent oxidoreductase